MKFAILSVLRGRLVAIVAGEASGMTVVFLLLILVGVGGTDFEVKDVPNEKKEEEFNWVFEIERLCWNHRRNFPTETVHSEELFPQRFCSGA